VPGGGNTAFFGSSSVTSLTNFTNLSLGGITLNANAGNYAIALSGANNIIGAGVTVNGGSLTLQLNNGSLSFGNNATAGSAVIISNSIY
uniref:hypothetical protein n=1 Tax=Proteus vulgaris TaxID=585 RepID=UPI0019547BBB